MSPQRKLAAALIVLASGLAGAMLFPAQLARQSAADPDSSPVPLKATSPVLTAEDRSDENTIATSQGGEDVAPLAGIEEERPSSQPAEGDKEPPQATLTTVTAVQLAAEASRPPDLPEQYPRLEPGRLRPPYSSVFKGEDETIEPGPHDERIHTVRDGDTLATLAKMYFGSADRAGEIYARNRDQLVSGDLLPIGVDLWIPAVEPASPRNVTVEQPDVFESGEPEPSDRGERSVLINGPIEAPRPATRGGESGLVPVVPLGSTPR